MNISIHIEQLIMDGLLIAHRDRDRLQSAIEVELARLLTDGALVVDLQTPGMMAHLTGGTLELTGDEEPHLLGKCIAEAIYRGIGL